MAEVKRKKNESFDSLLGRFKRRCQDRCLNQEVRRRQHHTHQPNRNKRRDGALRRVTLTEHYQYMAKTGQLKDEKPARGQQRRPS
ncbi:30S ribosomal protein S21 [Patescibacteria group bacterium]|nr:30S ribosomal protein S21 [Patescibacteria group bacterium]